MHPLQHFPSVNVPPGGPVHSGSTVHRQKVNLFPPQDTVDVYVPNIVIYGETGVGKSSIVNLIAGQKLAHSSNDALGCTFQHQRHIVELDGMSCALWGTTGLDEGSEGTVAAALAESNLRLLIQDLANTGGIHLIVYCIRAARLTKALQRNYDLFYVTVCGKKVPVALVVTGLEYQQGGMETWWTANKAVLRRYGMRFDAHACVTTLEVEDRTIQQRRLHSQRLLRELVVRYSRLPAWRSGPSFISSILPMFHAALRRTMVASRAKKSTPIPGVITRDTERVRGEGPSYGDYVDKRALEMYPHQVQHAGPIGGAQVRAYSSSTPLLWGMPLSCQREVDVLEVFCDCFRSSHIGGLRPFSTGTWQGQPY